MHKIIKILTSRLFLTLILFSVEVGMMICLVYWAAFTKGYYVYFYVLSILTVMLVMTRKEKPEYKMVWILLSAIFPVFAGVLYLLCGNKKIGKLSEKKVRAYRVDKKLRHVVENIEDRVIDNMEDESSRKLSQYIYNSTSFPAFSYTDAKYFAEGEDFLQDLLEEIRKARKYIFIEYFIIGTGECWDMILTELRKKVEEGVEVRLLYDDLGAINCLPLHYYKTLRSYGINAYAFNPVKLHFNPRLNFRDHRKIFCIDGNVCYTGGLNLADEYFGRKIRFGYWKDNAIKLTGSAVFSMTCLFLETWDSVTGMKDDIISFHPTALAEPDGFVQPFGFNPFVDDAVGENAYLSMIGSAKDYVWITTPYLIPDDGMIEALRMASISGVDVRIITPKIPDKFQVHEVTRSNYDVLLSSGVKIYEYTPGFVHSKMFLSDDNKAIIGTTNLDYRSFYLHFELSVAFYDSSICRDVGKDFDKLFELSEPILDSRTVRGGMIRRAFTYIYRLFSPAL